MIMRQSQSQLQFMAYFKCKKEVKINGVMYLSVHTTCIACHPRENFGTYTVNATNISKVTSLLEYIDLGGV